MHAITQGCRTADHIASTKQPIEFQSSFSPLHCAHPSIDNIHAAEINFIRGNQVIFVDLYQTIRNDKDRCSSYRCGRWDDGDLHTIFFSKLHNPGMRKQICSLLTGYVWYDTNPFVNNHTKQVRTLANFLRQTQPTPLPA